MIVSKRIKIGILHINGCNVFAAIKLIESLYYLIDHPCRINYTWISLTLDTNVFTSTGLRFKCSQNIKDVTLNEFDVVVINNGHPDYFRDVRINKLLSDYSSSGGSIVGVDSNDISISYFYDRNGRLVSNLPKMLSKAIDYMSRSMEEVSSIESIAQRANVSCRHLERLFKNYLDVTPRDYYLDLRLSRARILVEQTDTLITDIAQATGFSSPSHFSKAYKNKFGKSPRVARFTHN